MNEFRITGRLTADPDIRRKEDKVVAKFNHVKIPIEEI